MYYLFAALLLWLVVQWLHKHFLAHRVIAGWPTESIRHAARDEDCIHSPRC
ncbi:MAG: hypothetical protein IPG23_23640 [Burkholderiales bacterium]|nr:hypothetical protein [Burkholderiales bacterium]